MTLAGDLISPLIVLSFFFFFFFGPNQMKRLTPSDFNLCFVLSPSLLSFSEQTDIKHLLCVTHVLVAGHIAEKETDHFLVFTF